MLTHPTIDQLHQLGLTGMARAFTELEANPQSAVLSHAEWLGLLLDREATDRHERRLRARLRVARLGKASKGVAGPCVAASDSGGHRRLSRGEATFGSFTRVSAIRRGPESNTDAVPTRPGGCQVHSLAQHDGWHG